MMVLTRFLAIVGFLIASQELFAQNITIISKQGHIPADSLFKLVYVLFEVPEGIKERTNGFKFAVSDFDGIEVWNGKWDALDELALKWWDDLLRAGTAKLAIAASDTHTQEPSDNRLGIPQTVVKATGLSRTGIVRGLKAGRAYLVADRTS